jgi:beta-lactam-binding protein with PASTA domain
MRKALVVAILAALALPAASSPAPERRAVTVPQLRWLPVETAYAKLRARRLRVTTPANLHLASNIRTRVTRQHPAAGSRVSPGSVVRITDVGGPVGKPVGDETERRVPELRGLPVGEAFARIRAAGFRYWRATLRGPLHASTAPRLLQAYRVRSQAPAAGTLFRQREGDPFSFRLTPVSLTASPN